MTFDDLSPEQMQKAKSCKTPEEVLALAREEGYELSSEELDGIAGGSWTDCGEYNPDKYKREKFKGR